MIACSQTWRKIVRYWGFAVSCSGGEIAGSGRKIKELDEVGLYAARNACELKLAPFASSGITSAPDITEMAARSKSSIACSRWIRFAPRSWYETRRDGLPPTTEPSR